MKVNIIFPYNNVGGAFRSTYELSNELIKLGHNVCIYIPFFPYLDGFSFFSFEGIKLFVRGVGKSIIRQNKINWFNLKATVRIVPLISNIFIRDSDIIIANHWQTVKSVYKLDNLKGIKFNFIRDTNPWMQRPELESESFKVNLKRVVVNAWIKDHLINELNLSVEGVVPNGINFDDFEYQRLSYSYPPTIGMIYYDHPQKGMKYGFEALKRIHKKYPYVKIQLFGLSKPKKIPFKATFTQNPNKQKLRELYGTSDIFLFPSIHEGSGNPPREAMAAGCALVSTNVGCVPECCIADKTALIVLPKDVNGLFSSLSSLIENKVLTEKIGKRGQKYIKQFSWEKSAKTLEQIFKNNMNREKH